MNPEQKYNEINKSVWESVWDNMPFDYRRTIVNDFEHRTSVFGRFQILIENETNKTFESWAQIQESFVEPDSSESWLNPLTA